MEGNSSLFQLANRCARRDDLTHIYINFYLLFFFVLIFILSLLLSFFFFLGNSFFHPLRRAPLRRSRPLALFPLTHTHPRYEIVSFCFYPISEFHAEGYVELRVSPKIPLVATVIRPRSRTTAEHFTRLYLLPGISTTLIRGRDIRGLCISS